MILNERETLLQIRRGLLLINDALERYLEVGKHEPAEKSLGPAGNHRKEITRP
jgi:hypothetical protein